MIASKDVGEMLSSTGGYVKGATPTQKGGLNAIQFDGLVQMLQMLINWDLIEAISGWDPETNIFFFGVENSRPLWLKWARLWV